MRYYADIAKDALVLMEERHREIVAVLVKDGSVKVKALAESLNVSDDTIRRDLEALEGQGVLQKTHGGAVSLDVPRMERVVRAGIAPEAKQRIGATAARMVAGGATVFFDAGQTVLEAARRISVASFTAITQSLDVALILSERPGVRLIVVGGVWDRKQRFFSGPSTVQAMASFRADLAFLGACAVHGRFGVTATDDVDALIKKAIMQSSAKRILLADHTKFDIHEPFAVAPLDEYEAIITDQSPRADSSISHCNLIEAES